MEEEIACGDTVIRVEGAPPADRTITQIVQRKTRILLRDEERETAVEKPDGFLETLLPRSFLRFLGG